MSLIETFKTLIDDFQFAFHGVIGGLFNVVRGSEKSFKKAFVTMAGGALAAHYFTPWFVTATQKLLESEDVSGYSISFIIGYAGLVVIDLTEKLLTNRIKSLFSKKKVEEQKDEGSVN